MSTNCKKCGNTLQGREKFCPKCGISVDEEVVADKEDINTGDIIDRVRILIRPLSRYFIAAYMIGYFILIMLTGRWISHYTVAVAIQGLKGLGLAGVILAILIGAFGAFVNLFREYCYKENIKASELWVFGIKPEKRQKISMILGAAHWVMTAVGAILVISAVIPVYKIYGFSWMLLIQVAEPFMAVIFAEMLDEWSEAVAVGTVEAERKSE